MGIDSASATVHPPPIPVGNPNTGNGQAPVAWAAPDSVENRVAQVARQIPEQKKYDAQADQHKDNRGDTKGIWLCVLVGGIAAATIGGVSAVVSWLKIPAIIVASPTAIVAIIGCRRECQSARHNKGLISKAQQKPTTSGERYLSDLNPKITSPAVIKGNVEGILSPVGGEISPTKVTAQPQNDECSINNV